MLSNSEVSMYECPYCGSELNRPTRRLPSRTPPGPGRKSTGIELVTCPDCSGVIDGFSLH